MKCRRIYGLRGACLQTPAPAAVFGGCSAADSTLLCLAGNKLQPPGTSILVRGGIRVLERGRCWHIG